MIWAIMKTPCLSRNVEVRDHKNGCLQSRSCNASDPMFAKKMAMAVLREPCERFESQLVHLRIADRNVFGNFTTESLLDWCVPYPCRRSSSTLRCLPCMRFPVPKLPPTFHPPSHSFMHEPCRYARAKCDTIMDHQEQTACLVAKMNEFYNTRKTTAHRVILYPQSLFIHPPTTHIVCYNNRSLTEDLIQRFENATGCESQVRLDRRNYRTNMHERNIDRLSEDQCSRVRGYMRPDARLWDAHCKDNQVESGAALVPVPVSKRWVPPSMTKPQR